MSRIVSLLLALAGWFCSGFAMLAALFWGLGLKCDDSCSSDSLGGWRHDPDAWQWDAMATLGVLAFLAGGVVFVSVWRRKPLFGAVAVIVGLFATYQLANLFSSDWLDHFDRRGGGELLLIVSGVFAPIFAVLLTVPEMVRGRES